MVHNAVFNCRFRMHSETLTMERRSHAFRQLFDNNGVPL